MAHNAFRVASAATYVTTSHSAVDMSTGQTGTYNRAPFEYLGGNEVICAVYPGTNSTLSGYIVATASTATSTTYTTLMAITSGQVTKGKIAIPQYLAIVNATTAGHSTGSITVYLES